MAKQKSIEIVYLPIDQILEYDNNPRNNESAVPATAKSIKRYGIRTPAIIDKEGVLLAGHTRVKAAKSLGYTQFPCVRADALTKNEGKAFRLADNRAQEDSGWDTEALAAEFNSLKDNGFDLADTGFDEFEIGGIDMSSVDYEADYDTPEMESGDYEPEEPEDAEAEEDAEGEYVVIVACKDDEEKALLAEVIGETETLRRRYTVDDLRKMNEADTQE